MFDPVPLKILESESFMYGNIKISLSKLKNTDTLNALSVLSIENELVNFLPDL